MSSFRRNDSARLNEVGMHRKQGPALGPAISGTSNTILTKYPIALCS